MTLIAPTPLPSEEGHDALAKRMQRMLGISQGQLAESRANSRVNCEFFYNQQWAPDKEAIVRGRGQEPVVINEAAAQTRIVLGQMLGRPMDWAAYPVGLDDDDKALMAKHALKFVANENGARGVYRDVFLDGLTAGYGCVLTGPHVRDDDPRSEVVQFVHVPWSEVWIDPEARRMDLGDCRWLIWRRQVSREQIEALFGVDPLEERGEWDAGGSGGMSVNTTVYPDGSVPARWERLAPPDACAGMEAGSEDRFWLNETWEIQKRPTYWIRWDDGRVESLGSGKKADLQLWLAEHQAELQRAESEAAHAQMMGLPVEEAPHRVVHYWRGTERQCVRTVWSGMRVAESAPIDQAHQQIPWAIYVWDNDHNGRSFGYMSYLRDLQMERNFRHSKAMFALVNNPVRVSPEELHRLKMTTDQVAEQIAGGSPVFAISPGGIEFLAKPDAPGMHLQAGQMVSELMQKVGGTNDHMMGYGGGDDVSGKAKEIAISQAQTANRDGEERLLAFHKRLGTLLLADIQQYHRDEWWIRVTDDAGAVKALRVNATNLDPRTGQATKTTIYDTPFSVSVDSQPWTPTMRQEAFERLNGLASQMPDPVLMLKMRKLAIKSSDLPNRSDVMALLDEAIAVASAPPPMSMPPEQAGLTPPGAAPAGPGLASDPPPGPMAPVSGPVSSVTAA